MAYTISIQGWRVSGGKVMGKPVRPLPRLASLTHERFAVAPSTVACSQLDFVKATGFLNPKPNSKDLRPESLPSNTYPRARGAKLSKGYRSMVILVCKAQSTHGTMTPMRPLGEDKSYNPSCAFAWGGRAWSQWGQKVSIRFREVHGVFTEIVESKVVGV